MSPKLTEMSLKLQSSATLSTHQRHTHTVYTAVSHCLHSNHCASLGCSIPNTGQNHYSLPLCPLKSESRTMVLNSCRKAIWEGNCLKKKNRVKEGLGLCIFHSIPPPHHDWDQGPGTRVLDTYLGGYYKRTWKNVANAPTCWLAKLSQTCIMIMRYIFFIK